LCVYYIIYLSIASHADECARSRYTCPARFTARAIARTASARQDKEAGVWYYYFNQIPQCEAATYGLAGACHGCEMAFVWRNDPELQGRTEHSLSDAMSAAWVNLAEFGNPNGKAGAAFDSDDAQLSWPGWTRLPGADLGAADEQPLCMSFGGPPGSAVAKMTTEGMRYKHCAFWDSLSGHCADVYEQCGGLGWHGADCCIAGCTCTNVSKFYLQCKPPTGKSTCH
jgi:hypothetical protein